MEKDYIITKGLKKINNYVLELIKSNDFKELVTRLRKKFKIPESGFVCPNGLYGIEITPDEWRGSHSKAADVISDEAQIFCERKGLGNTLMPTHIYDYIVFNIPIEVEEDLCLLFDAKEREKLKNIKIKGLIGACKEMESKQNSSYPIVIAISPYASNNDITDFIRKNNKKIKGMQRLYAKSNIKVAKFRSKKCNIQERNDFIYRNRNLPYKNISKLVSDNFDKSIDVDQGAIGKIISLEAKRRKEV